MRKNIWRLFVSSSLISIMAANSILAAGWKQGIGKDTGRWYYDKGNGARETNSWQWLDGNSDGIAECYCFDADGWMYAGTFTPDGYEVNENGAWMSNGVVQTKSMGGIPVSDSGWKLENGRWYYEENNGTRKSGGWYWLDGNHDGRYECYYFDNQGCLLVETITPDGYFVNSSGAWTENGIVQIQTGLNSTGGSNYSGGNGSSGRNSSSGGNGSSGRNKSSGGNSSSGKSSSSSGNGSSGGKSYSNNGTGSGGSRKYTADTQIDDEEDYQDVSVRYSANDFKTGNYDMMTSSQIKETEEKIAEFKRTHLNSTMSDFEKEVEIVKWLISNCDYEVGEDWENSTAYSCIVNGTAQCAGYADAFLQTAKACGLDARYINNEVHAWNLVKLDGDWYHIDVTWEDAGERLDSRALFFNLTDDQARETADHETWSPATIKANGTKYGPGVVEHYLKTGIIDTSIKESTSNDLYEFTKDVKSDTGGEVILYTNVEDTANKVAAYISDRIDDGCDNYEYVIKFKEKYDSSKEDSGLESSKLDSQILYEVERLLDLKYVNVYRSAVRVSSLRFDQNSYFYVHRKANLLYPDETVVTYRLRFMYNGNEIHTTMGEAKKGEQVEIDFPGDYKPDEGKGYTVNKGKAVYTGSTFTITGASAVDMEIIVLKDNLQEE